MGREGMGREGKGREGIAYALVAFEEQIAFLQNLLQFRNLKLNDRFDILRVSKRRIVHEEIEYLLGFCFSHRLNEIKEWFSHFTLSNTVDP
jgi:hypothetical protein